MHSRSLGLLAIITVGFLLTGCGTKTLTLSSSDGEKQVVVQIEIADSPEEREKGLMNRGQLAPDAGMLFVFTEPQMVAFWMKNTTIPLEIYYFDEAGVFVNMYAMEPCVEDPCTTYKAAAQSVYALEVAPGFREAHGIGTGWKLDLAAVKKMVKPT